MDMDFDGVEDLVIVRYQMGAKEHPEYDVYRIVEERPFQIDYPPFIVERDRLTDYPEFDFKKKTIDCPVPEGSWKYDCRIIYGVSKKKKDIIKVNGREHYFNHIEEVRRIVFDE